VLAAVGLGVVLLAAAASLWPADFSPGERLVSPEAKDIAVSTQDAAYPDSDALRFEGRPGVVYVYLRVEDFGAGRDFGARAERTARGSVVGRLLGGGGLRVVEGEVESLRASGGGVSGVVKFAVRSGSGKRLPAGNYTVEIYGGGYESLVASKHFVVGD